MAILSRREFIAASATSAGGMMLAFYLPAHAKSRPYEAYPGDTSEVNAWLVIEPDNTVTIRCAQAEMGEGVFTAMPMLIAEELEVEWSKVRVEYASANRSLRENNVYGRMTTTGSQAIRGSRAAVQEAGANARERLRMAAARRWKVPVGECRAELGKIYHAGSGRSLAYGEIARAAAAITDVPKVPIKTADQFKLAGKPMRRLDVKLKVDGSAIFGIDIRLPGMLYAFVAHCPVFGGTVKSYDFDAVKTMPGVKQAINLGNGVAVVADHYWEALSAAKALPIEWEKGPAGSSSSAQWHKDFTVALDTDAGNVAQEAGDAAGALAASAKQVAADYYVPYLPHAAMEPLNCTAHAQADRVDLWLGTQSPDGMLNPVAQIAGVDPKNVYVHNCFLGGGFGRRGASDFVVEAVRISKAAGAPVQMIWSREEDMRMGLYRPMSAVRFQAGLGADGNPVAYVSHSVTPSIFATFGRPMKPTDVDFTSVDGLTNIPYVVANQRVTNVRKETHLPAWFWRAVGKTQNVFVLESFIDELAAAAGKDPLEYRLQLLKPELADHIRVLNVLKEKSQWGRKLPAGTAQGVAISESVGSIVGQVAEVSVTKAGVVKVERVVSVIDCGNLVNPLTVEEQVEGSAVWALTAALYGKLTVENGAIKEDNFNTYRMLQMADTPVVETHFSLAGGNKWGGIGEAAVGTVAPAVTNAIFRVTGKRVRSLPLSDHNLSWS